MVVKFPRYTNTSGAFGRYWIKIYYLKAIKIITFHTFYKISGVVFFSDTTPDEKEDVEAVKTHSFDAEDKSEAPEPFEWAPPGHPDHAIVYVTVDKTK